MLIQIANPATRGYDESIMPTILHRLHQWAKDTPDAPAQMYKNPNEHEWIPISAKEYCNRVYYIALFLESRGFKKSDIGVVFSFNCPQWTHMDLGAILMGGKSAGIYPNANPKDIHYVLEQTEAPIISIQNRLFWEKLVGTQGEAALPSRIKTIVVFDGDTSISPLAISYEQALEEGRKIAQSARKTKMSEYLERLDPNAGQVLIYTSGTTGSPKGALLSLDNFTFTADMVARAWKLPYGHGSLFSFLPLCHVAEKIQSLGAGLTQRYIVYFGSKIENVSKELPQAEPQLMLSVPRLWEKMMETVLNHVEQSTGVQKKLVVWALDVGKRVSEARSSGRMPGPADLIQYKLADKLVFSKIRKSMGLAKADCLASGAAALSGEVSRWFRSIGMEILEDYGQTESTGVICITVPGMDCSGTVGKPAPGIEFKLAEDGEIMTRGRHVFKGYFNNPEETAKTLVDGWLCTGDLGEWTDRGMVRIRGRKKEIMKTSGGKMIAPLPIEDSIKSSPLISQVCIVGDGRKYVTALVTLSESKMQQLKAANALKAQGKTIDIDDLNSELRKHFDSVNKELASYEQIKNFKVLAHEFSIEGGEMTPTMKMKRSIIEKNYSDVIESMYS